MGLFDVLKICGAAVLAITLSAVLKNRSSPLAPYLTQITALTVFITVITSLVPLVSFIRSLITKAKVEFELFGLLMSAVAVAIVCQVVSDICKSNGENSLASAVEFAGNAEIIIISLPLLGGLINTAFEVLGV